MMMEKICQHEWQGIAFNSFAETDAGALAGPAFYEKFYQAFFSRYYSWDDLDVAWRKEKATVAKFLFDQLGSEDSVLALGCGLGFIEHCLLAMSHGAIRLDLTEVAPAALKWISKELPQERLHLGPFPQCLPQDRRYDLIYLSALDYCLDQPTLIALLGAAADRLTPQGRCLMISSAFQPARPGWARTLKAARQAAKKMLVAFHLYHPGQFWGWQRSAGEYYEAFSRAGFSRLRDGVIEGVKTSAAYWLEGKIR